MSSALKSDEISQAIGSFGTWQCYLTIFLSLFNIPSTWHIYVPTFITPTSNLTDKITVSSEFHLSGDREYFISLAESMFLSGVAVGGVVGGLISDRYGRRNVLISSVAIQAVLAFILVFVQNIELYVIVRTMLGLICVSVVFTAFVLAIELVDGKWRNIVGVLFLLPVSVGYVTISCLAWYFNNWRHLQLIMAMSSFLLLGFAKWIPESPRWLHSANKTEALNKLLKQVSRINKMESPKYLLSKKLTSNKQMEDDDVQITHLCSTGYLMKVTLLSCIMWFSLYLVYYGLVLRMDRLGTNIYIDSITAGFSEILAVSLTVLVLLKLNIRRITCWTFIGSGIASLSIALFATGHNRLLPIVMIAKFGISSTNAVIPILTAELYPTRMRNMGVGACNIPAGIALMSIPYLWKLETVPMYVVGVMSITGGICTALLPHRKRYANSLDDDSDFD